MIAILIRIAMLVMLRAALRLWIAQRSICTVAMRPVQQRPYRSICSGMVQPRCVVNTTAPGRKLKQMLAPPKMLAQKVMQNSKK